MNESTPPTAIIADDEPNLRTHLANLLALTWSELQIVGLAGNGSEAQKMLSELKPTVAFLDIRMPEPSGLELGRAYAKDVLTVFVTAYDQHAVEAFDQAAVDYLLKPVTKERLTQTIARLKERIQQPSDFTATITKLDQLIARDRAPYLKQLRVDKRGATILVDVADVVFFQADLKYTGVHTPTAQHLLRTSLTELEKSLDPQIFWRIHRSTIVNSTFVESAVRDYRGRFRVSMKETDRVLSVSRTYAHLFRPQ